jgi:hypothetical protein
MTRILLLRYIDYLWSGCGRLWRRVKRQQVSPHAKGITGSRPYSTGIKAERIAARALSRKKKSMSKRLLVAWPTVFEEKTKGFGRALLGKKNLRSQCPSTLIE